MRGTGQQDLFLSEESHLDATTVYGVTKSCAEAVGKSYVRNFGCHIIFTRSFNHTGPGAIDGIRTIGFRPSVR